MPTSPFGAFLGIRMLSASDGKSHCQIKLEPHHMNNGGRVHGGVLTSLADTAAGMAVRTVRPADSHAATTDLSIAFIRPPGGDTLDAHAEVIHAGRRLFRVEISVFSDDKLVARTTATFMIIDRP